MYNGSKGFEPNIDVANQEIARLEAELAEAKANKPEPTTTAKKSTFTGEQPKVSGLSRAIAANQKAQAQK